MRVLEAHGFALVRPRQARQLQAVGAPVPGERPPRREGPSGRDRARDLAASWHRPSGRRGVTVNVFSALLAREARYNADGTFDVLGAGIFAVGVPVLPAAIKLTLVLRLQLDQGGGEPASSPHPAAAGRCEHRGNAAGDRARRDAASRCAAPLPQHRHGRRGPRFRALVTFGSRSPLMMRPYPSSTSRSRSGHMSR